MPLSRVRDRQQRQGHAAAQRRYAAKGGAAFRAAHAARMRDFRARQKLAAQLVTNELGSAKREAKRLRSDSSRFVDERDAVRSELAKERSSRCPDLAQLVFEVCLRYVGVSFARHSAQWCPHLISVFLLVIPLFLLRLCRRTPVAFPLSVSSLVTSCSCAHAFCVFSFASDFYLSHRVR
jgi:hypothetical protein